jgi:hypothetical protein
MRGRNYERETRGNGEGKDRTYEVERLKTYVFVENRRET